MKTVQVKIPENLHLVLNIIKNLESEKISTILEKALVFYIKNYDKIYKMEQGTELSDVYIDVINVSLSKKT